MENIKAYVYSNMKYEPLAFIIYFIIIYMELFYFCVQKRYILNVSYNFLWISQIPYIFGCETYVSLKVSQLVRHEMQSKPN